MKHSLLIMAACLAGVQLIGCSAAKKPPVDNLQITSIPRPEVKPENVLVTVNGKAIPRSALQQHRQGNAPEDKQRDELAQREILRQDAQKQHLLEQPDVIEKIDNTLRMVISQVAADQYLKGLVISDDDLKKEYESRFIATQKLEYNARHILVDSEKKARDIIQKLGKGVSFESLAKKMSTDEGSKGQGGDLGWFTHEQMVEPFASAVAALKPGDITHDPVQTQFGWHVIELRDSRQQQPPAYEQVKGQLLQVVQARKFQSHMDELKKAAQVDLPAANNTAEKSSSAPAPAAVSP